MIANATAHRRANAFAQALDAQAPAPDGPAPDGPAPEGQGKPPEQETGARTPAHGRGAHAADRHADAAQDRMLTLADALGRFPSPEMDPEVKVAQRAQLVAAMEAAFAGGTFDPAEVRVPEQRSGGQGAHRASTLSRFRPRSPWSRRLAAGGLAFGVAAGGLGGVAVASSDALPGDTLYGFKRSMEDLRLSMADGDTGRGEVFLDLASTRLREARRLMDRSKAGPLEEDQLREVRRTLSGMHDEAAQGHRLLADAYRRDGSLAPIQALADFSDTQRGHWSQLRRQLPEQLAVVRDSVSYVFDAIEDEVAPLRALLPPSPGGSRDAGGDSAAPGASGGSAQQTGPGAQPPSTVTGAGPAGPDGSQESESGSPGAADEGLLGGGGLIESPSPSGGESSSGGGGSPGREVTLPPLLPQLLPNLSLAPEDD